MTVTNVLLVLIVLILLGINVKALIWCIALIVVIAFMAYRWMDEVFDMMGFLREALITLVLLWVFVITGAYVWMGGAA